MEKAKHKKTIKRIVKKTKVVSTDLGMQSELLKSGIAVKPMGHKR